MGPAKAHIDVYARVRPAKRPSGNFDMDFANHAIAIHMAKDNTRDVINNQRQDYSFAFSRILDAATTQDQVFETIAQPVVDSVLEGYNGTIFAYGQTGSGKTFTITGGAERYVDRGIIPRALSHIFSKLAESSDTQYEVRVSYLEIYNESGYDLLEPSHETKGLEDLPKVSLQEDTEGRIHLKNLSAQVARSEEEALNLLFVGDTNRMISETPMNMASSRSHCIFTIGIEARKEGEDVVRRSKLHLVDLAGSERVKKTGIEGTVFREARYINLSLHYLEQVIIALQEKKFVPYRNSMMTSVLRDSLGGNCKTVMVATLSSEEPYLDETISTCRFAQRVALIANRLEVNEELDPRLLVARLKAEVRELKEEIQILRGEGYERSVDALSAEERARCEQLIGAYMVDTDGSAMLNPGEMAKIQMCFRLLRERVLSGGGGGRGGGGGGAPSAPAAAADGDEVSRLRMQLQQRDHEINILVSMLNKNGGSNGGAPAALAAGSGAAAVAAAGGIDVSRFAGAAGAGVAAMARSAPPPAASEPPVPTGEELAAKREKVKASVAAVGACGTEAGDALIERNAAFEAFRRSYRKNEVIEENKLLLKGKYDEAKSLGESVNAARSDINSLKGQIEAVRRKSAMAEVASEGDGAAFAAEEEPLKAKLEEGKRTYKEGFAKLKGLKSEIEHLQHLLEQSRRRLQQDFETWFSKQQSITGRPASPAMPPATAQSSHDPVHVPCRASIGASPRRHAAAASIGASPRRHAGAAPAPPQQCWGSPAKPSAPPAPAAGAGAAVASAQAPMLTGQPEVDAEIMAFYQARDSLVKARLQK